MLVTYLGNVINRNPRFYTVGGTWIRHTSKPMLFGAQVASRREGRVPAYSFEERSGYQGLQGQSAFG